MVTPLDASYDNLGKDHMDDIIQLFVTSNDNFHRIGYYASL